MGKFCIKCGAKLDSSTGKCPNCDDEKVKQKTVNKKEQKIQKKEGKKEKYLQWSRGKKMRKFLLKCILIILLLGLLVVSIIGILAYFEVANIPIASKVINYILSNDHSTDIEKKIPETDTEGLIYYRSSEENVVQDSDTGITFINNEILVTLISESYKKQLQEYLQTIGGKIVGEISELAEYQILLNEGYSYTNIEKLIRNIEHFDWVSSASPNYAMKMDKSYIPNDEEWKNRWEEVPDGNNWGMEAIDAPGAWEYRNQLQEVNIGLLDDMFDTNHKDLNFAEMPLGNIAALSAIEKGNLEWSDHGTHVSGTMAAIIDNNEGVAGICTKTNLYGVSARGLETSGYSYFTSQGWNMAFCYLIVQKNCSVINLSCGWDQLTFEASRKEPLATEQLKIIAEGIEKLLKNLIDRGYSFVICKAAGNQNEIGGRCQYRYFKKDSDDEKIINSYYSYKDYLEFLEGDKTNEAEFARYKNREKEIESRLDSGNVDAKYDILGAITDPSVAKRIIIVGAAENLGTHKEGGFLGIGGTKIHDGYTIAAFSQCGERVDIIAPGVAIYSTIKNGYGEIDGTSMAAPHVAGVVGLIFSVNPDIKADDVKQIVCDTAVGHYGKEDYGLLNAANAVEAALKYTPNEKETDAKLNQSDIPSGAVEFNGHYYYLYDTSTVFTYEDAAQYCKDKGGYLATITSQEENDFLYNYIAENNCSTAYFGFTDQDEEGTWRWGNGETSSYTNWHSGEPNSENSNEDFAMYYYKYPDGTWNDGDFREENGGRAFLCEWGDYETGYADVQENMERSEEREIVLVLDISSSMAGTPLDETKKASLNFIDTVLKEDAATGIVTYSNSAERVSDFSTKGTVLQDRITYLQSSGNTDIESGLQEAEYMLDGSNAKKKIMVLMSDGEPNSGKTGNDLISYADSIKEKGIMIYTLGFFENLGDKSGAQQLMEDIASEGCHYEVANADDLVFFFQDIADQINGQKYIYVRIACPVDVSVTYNGQTLSSSEMDRNERTDFGTLTFEEAEDSNGQNLEDAAQDADEQIKILRLKEENDYDLKITGNGYGMMNYTIGFMDDDGTYNDFREFRDIRITRKTQIDTVAAVSSESILNIDENGDGKYDLKLRAVKNGYGEEVKLPQWIIYAVGGASILILIDVIIIIIKVRRKRKGNF